MGSRYDAIIKNGLHFDGTGAPGARRNLGIPQEFGVKLGVLCVGPLPPESGRLNDVERHGRNGNWPRRARSKPSG